MLCCVAMRTNEIRRTLQSSTTSLFVRSFVCLSVSFCGTPRSSYSDPKLTMLSANCVRRFACTCRLKFFCSKHKQTNRTNSLLNKPNSELCSSVRLSRLFVCYVTPLIVWQHRRSYAALSLSFQLKLLRHD